MKRVYVSIAIVVVALASFPIAREQSAREWTGWVTDDHCGAKGAKSEHKGCATRCPGNDAGQVLLFDRANERHYRLDKPKLAERHLGHEVKVTGTVDGDSIKVESIAPAR